MNHPVEAGSDVFGYVCSSEFLDDLLIRRDGLTSFISQVLVLHVVNTALADPEEDLLRIAGALGSPVPYDGLPTPCLQMTNSALTPLEERNKAVEWHQDDIHTAAPSRYTLLYCLEAPHENPPSTLFANLRSAYTHLGASTRHELRELVVWHDPVGGSVATDDEFRGRFGHKADGGAHHPLVLAHPFTGRRQLFAVAGTAAGIRGMPHAKAAELLRNLKRFAVQPPFQFAPTLRAGELLIWDNLATLHSATPIHYSDDDGKRRRVLRVSVR